jgi:hypothetical protein
VFPRAGRAPHIAPSTLLRFDQPQSHCLDRIGASTNARCTAHSAAGNATKRHHTHYLAHQEMPPIHAMLGNVNLHCDCVNNCRDESTGANWGWIHDSSRHNRHDRCGQNVRSERTCTRATPAGSVNPTPSLVKRGRWAARPVPERERSPGRPLRWMATPAFCLSSGQGPDRIPPTGRLTVTQPTALNLRCTRLQPSQYQRADCPPLPP